MVKCAGSIRVSSYCKSKNLSIGDGCTVIESGSGGEGDMVDSRLGEDPVGVGVRVEFDVDGLLFILSEVQELEERQSCRLEQRR